MKEPRENVCVMGRQDERMCVEMWPEAATAANIVWLIVSLCVCVFDGAKQALKILQPPGRAVCNPPVRSLRFLEGLEAGIRRAEGAQSSYVPIGTPRRLG